MHAGHAHCDPDQVSVGGCLSGCTFSDVGLFPALDDRVAWRTVPKPRQDALIRAAEEALRTPWTSLPPSLYRRFCEDGNRVAFETAYFSRRLQLNDLVQGEAVEGAGRFLEQIRHGVALLCEETAWQLPAHNRETRGGEIRPEPIRHIVDLFAAETGAQLAVIHALFGDRLELPVAQEVRARVLTPYLEREFWWMGLSGGRMNNWTVWCTQNVLIAAFLLPLSEVERQRIVARAAVSLDAFLAEYGPDGACPEGAYYYGHAALRLFTALDVLNKVTGGALAPLMRSEKLRNIADFVLYTHIDGDLYANFGDSPARMPGPDHRVGQFGAAVGSSALTGYARRYAARPGSGEDADNVNLYDRLSALFHQPGAGTYEPVEGFLPSIGMFVARDDRFYVAANAGHNGADHNHNDVGNLIVYRDGAPVLIDIGVETYSAKTFSPDRYDIWTMQSSFHNLPEIGGVMQQAGREFAAHDVRARHDAATATLDMDIAGAYPAGAGLSRYHRQIALDRGRAVRIHDRFEADRPVVLNLICASAPRRDGNRFVLGENTTLTLTGAAHVEQEDIPVTDPRLAQSWSTPLYRLRITPAADRIDMVIA